MLLTFLTKARIKSEKDLARQAQSRMASASNLRSLQNLQCSPSPTRISIRHTLACRISKMTSLCVRSSLTMHLMSRHGTCLTTLMRIIPTLTIGLATLATPATAWNPLKFLMTTRSFKSASRIHKVTNTASRCMSTLVRMIPWIQVMYTCMSLSKL